MDVLRSQKRKAVYANDTEPAIRKPSAQEQTFEMQSPLK